MSSPENVKHFPLFAAPDTASETPDVEQCPHCFGSGMEVVAGKGARRCKCRAQAAAPNLLAAAHIPRRYANCIMQNYYPANGNGTQFRAFSYAMRMVNEYPALDRGILFMGTVGVGKTHLSVAILQGLLAKGVPCLFYDSGGLLKKIQDSYSKVSHTSELGLLAPVFQTEVLVLDELGASKPTDWVRDTMMHIIGKRYNDQKLTIFTTNYLDARRGTEETLEERIGVRLRSRLYEMCKTVVVEGEDWRKKRDAQNL